MKRIVLFVLSFLSLLTVSYGQFEEGFAPSEGVEIHYEIYGKGEPLLLVNGGPGFPSYYFREIAKKLASDRQVIIFDQRGTGDSYLQTYDRSTVNLKKMVADIEALRTHLGIKKWDVMGHSFGGVLSMLYCAEHGDKVKKLVLSASGGMDLEFIKFMPANIQSRLNNQQTLEMERLNAQYQKDQSNMKIHNQRFEILAWAYVYDKNKVKDAALMLTEGNRFQYRVNQLVWKDLRAREYDVTQELKHFKQPVFIVHGRQDVISESVAIKTHMNFPNSTLAFINEASHYIWLDQEAEYLRLIHGFLK
ncbi:MAG: alpha/beta hydrolase [Saprospiraceae bacterium]|nr:alpha/beta hydrolase [Saprospiraceae bacterium]